MTHVAVTKLILLIHDAGFCSEYRRSWREPEEAGAGEEAAMPANYEETSAELYDAELGDFWAAYQKADEAQTVSERFALQAIAEAKLMESAVMLPLQSKGGNYAITRVAPYTIDYALWGTNNQRFHNALVTTDLIKASVSAQRGKNGLIKRHR